MGNWNEFLEGIEGPNVEVARLEDNDGRYVGIPA
jgi:hypothetical protein